MGLVLYLGQEPTAEICRLSNMECPRKEKKDRMKGKGEGGGWEAK
jgi:hypothetical protein